MEDYVFDVINTLINLKNLAPSIQALVFGIEWFIKYYSLGREYCAIEYDKKDIFPDLVTMELNKVQAKESLSRFKKELDETLHNEYELNENLKLALDIYSKHAQNNKKSQFLDLVTILEILKEDIPVSNDSLNTINDIKKFMKSIRKNFENGSDEYEEFNGYFNDLSHWKYKSINNSLQIFANKHKNEFNEYEDINIKLKRAYDIRSNITHNGLIEDDFEEYYNFLRRFVGKLLKIMIDETKK